MTTISEDVTQEPVHSLTRVDGLCAIKWDDIDPAYHWLANRGYGWQFGEQGMLQSVLTVLGLDSGKVFECGAGDAHKLPLTCQGLILEGWKSLLVEPNSACFETLKARMAYFGIKNATFCSEVLCAVENRMDGAVTIDELFNRERFHPDVMILDIDSYEWYILKGMEERPKVVLVEHMDIAYPDQPLEIPAIEECGKPMQIPTYLKQGTWYQTKAMMESKGYTAVAKTRVNGLYVRNDLAAMVAEGPIKHKWKKVENPRCTIILSQPRLGFTDHALRVANVCRELGYNVANSMGAFWDRDISLVTEGVIKEQSPDFLIYSDYDSVFSVDDVRKLVETINSDPEMGAIGAVQMSRHDDRPLVMDADTDYSKPISEVRYQHFGLTVVRRQVFEQIPQPWFWSLPNLDGSWSAPNRSDADITFWRLLHEHQFKVCQHNEVVIGHMIVSVKWPSNTGRGVTLQPIENYNRTGKPKNAVFTPELYKPKPE